MRKVPELRFDGFDGEWEENYLSEIAKINPKSTPLPEKFKYVDLTSVSGTRLINFDIINKEEAPSRAQRVAKKGDIFYQTVRPYQKNNFFFDLGDKDFIFSTGYAQIRTTNNSRYLFTFMQTQRFVDTVMNRTTGTSFPAISTSELSDINIKIPRNISEQEKIGDLFKKIDALIEIQEGKVAKMEDFKKSMLQKMFPKKDEIVPEFRFDGFDVEWEDLSIGDKYEVTMGQSPKSENYTSDTNSMVLVQGNADLENGRVTPRIYTKEVTKTSKKGDILMTVRAPVGTLAINEYDVVIGRGVCSIKGNTFLYYSLTNKNLNNYWNRFSSGSTFESINSSDIKNAGLKKPSISEQKKIGNFFKNLDTQIENEEKLLESYKMMKKSLLQKMFV